MSDTFIVFSGALLVLGSTLIIFGTWFNYKANMAKLKAARTEAVERGYAEWATDSSGNTTFQWKEVAK